VLTAREMVAWDRLAMEGFDVAERVLVESAGRAAAAVVARLYPDGRVLCVSGAGNNGADGVVLARTLAAWGRDVSVVAVGSRAPDAALAHGWPLPLAGAEGLGAALAGADVVVDALLGTGARGAPRGAVEEAIRAIGGAGGPVVALDLPSGVDATTGGVEGEAVRAATTITFGAPKRGLLLFPGRTRAGRIVVVEIGLPPLADADAWLVTHRWAREVLPAVAPDAHKGRTGTVAIVAGRHGMAGACVLAGWGTLRAGAGMARLCSAAGNREILQAALPEALFVERDAGVEAIVQGAAALVAGPAMGTDAAAGALLGSLLEHGGLPAVLDADAITLVGADPSLLGAERSRLLLTPHPGEMARLLGCSTADVTADPFAAAREAAERHGCAVLLKGAPSLVAAPGLPLLVSVTGHSGLATGGNGDVLAGVAGAFLARGMPPREAAGAALWFAGRAAELAGRGRGLLPRDVAAALPAALLEEPATGPRPRLPGILLDLPAAR
jgi:ADP-dependent NAD(P)H-hydrate dehydratase / NAD(P)H-hydrate epimerase